MVAHLGQIDKAGRLGVQYAAQDNSHHRQKLLFDDTEPQWVQVDASKVRVEKV